MRVAVAFCLFLIKLALYKNTASCTLCLESSKCDCNRLLATSNMLYKKELNDYRILIYYHHFIKLEEEHKICLLQKIFRFYKKTEPDNKHLQWLLHNCFKCVNFTQSCSHLQTQPDFKEELRNHIPIKENYTKSLNLTATIIMQYQLKLLKTAQKKRKSNLTEIQEKLKFEIPSLCQFLSTLRRHEI